MEPAGLLSTPASFCYSPIQRLSTLGRWEIATNFEGAFWTWWRSVRLILRSKALPHRVTLCTTSENDPTRAILATGERYQGWESGSSVVVGVRRKLRAA